MSKGIPRCLGLLLISASSVCPLCSDRMQEIRYSLRSLWHIKAVAGVAIVCLGLGIGINTTIFSIIDGVILKPFPYEEPNRIFLVGTQKLKEHEQAGTSLA